MLRFSGSLDCISNNNYYCDDHAYYDSSVYYTNNSYQKPKVGGDGCYEPNTSWQRWSYSQQKELCANSLRTVRSHIGNIKPVRKLTDN